VRWTATGLDGTLGAALRADVHDDDAPANITVVVGAAARGVRSKHELYVQGRLVLISASAERITRAVVRALGDLAVTRPADSLALQALVAFDPDGRVTLVDRQLVEQLWALDRPLRRAGWRVVDTAEVYVDLATASVSLSNAADLVVDGYLTGDRPDSGTSDGLDDLRGGQIPIARIVFAGTADGSSMARTLAEAAPLVWQRDSSLRLSDLDALLGVLRRVDYRSSATRSAAALRATLGLPAREPTATISSPF
jgi:hypothetical protein